MLTSIQLRVKKITLYVVLFFLGRNTILRYIDESLASKYVTSGGPFSPTNFEAIDVEASPI